VKEQLEVSKLSGSDFRNFHNFPVLEENVANYFLYWSVSSMSSHRVQYGSKYSPLDTITIEHRQDKALFILDCAQGNHVSEEKWRKIQLPCKSEFQCRLDGDKYSRILVSGLDFRVPEIVDTFFSELKKIGLNIPSEIIQDIKYYLIASQVSWFLLDLEQKRSLEQAIQNLNPYMIKGVPSSYFMAAKHLIKKGMPNEAVILLSKVSAKHADYKVAKELREQLMEEGFEKLFLENQALKSENEKLMKELESLRKQLAAQSALAAQPKPVLFVGAAQNNDTVDIKTPAASSANSPTAPAPK
jgi:hypothetical protein